MSNVLKLDRNFETIGAEIITVMMVDGAIT
jgi:hypothetical protein